MKKIFTLLFVFVMVFGLAVSAHAITIFPDDFNDGNDNGWQHIRGTEFHVENGEYSLGSASDGIITLTIVDGLSFIDATITVDVTNISSDTDSFMAFDYIDSNNWKGWGFQNNRLHYNNVVNGIQQIQDIGGASFGGTHSYKVDKQGNTLKLYYDNTLYFTDQSFVGNIGSIGLWTIDGHAHFDNFSASGTAESEAVPEPTTIVLLGIGLAGLAGAAIRRRLKRVE